MIYIINFGSGKTPNIKQMVEELGHATSVIGWDQTGLIDHNYARAYILSGAPVLLTKTNHEPYLKSVKFIKNTNKPVLGICFGHQLIGLLYAASVFKGKENRTPTGISIKRNNEILQPNKIQTQQDSNPIIFAEDHTEGISLPKDFILLASSTDYELEAMKHVRKNIFGVQFHPEVSGENGKNLLRRFLQLCLC